MHVAVIGGGRSGSAIVGALEARGCVVTPLSRSTGFDVVRDDAAAVLAGVDVIIEATGQFTTSRKKATAFFTASTRALSAAAKQHNAHHILLSIANCTRPEVQGYGYFAGKTAQERVARDMAHRLTIVRSTQWHEFAAQNLERMRFGPFALIPGMTIAPIALDVVATTIATVAVGERTEPIVEVGGPETTTLWEMTKAIPHAGIVPVPLPIPGTMGHAFRAGALLPESDVEVLGPGFSDWVSRRK